MANSASQGRIKTDANDVFVEFRNSSKKHPRDPDGVAVKEILRTMRQRAERETTSVGAIYRQEIAAVASRSSTAAAMPSFVVVRKKLLILQPFDIN